MWLLPGDPRQGGVVPVLLSSSVGLCVDAAGAPRARRSSPTSRPGCRDSEVSAPSVPAHARPAAGRGRPRAPRGGPGATGAAHRSRERLHHPDFGAGLGGAALFEPLDEALLRVVEVRARGSLERRSATASRSTRSRSSARASRHRCEGHLPAASRRTTDGGGAFGDTRLQPTCPPSARPQELLRTRRRRARAAGGAGPAGRRQRVCEVWLFRDPPAALPIRRAGRSRRRPGPPVPVDAGALEAPPDAARQLELAGARPGALPGGGRPDPPAVPSIHFAPGCPSGFGRSAPTLGAASGSPGRPAPAAAPANDQLGPRLPLAAPRAARVPAAQDPDADLSVADPVAWPSCSLTPATCCTTASTGSPPRPTSRRRGSDLGAPPRPTRRLPGQRRHRPSPSCTSGRTGRRTVDVLR